MNVSTILTFRPTQGRIIPTPAFYRHGDEYDILELHDDSLLRAGFVKGCVFVIKVGSVFPGGAHLSIWQDRPRLGYVTECGERDLFWHSFDALMPSGRYKRREVELVGAVTEIWSFGLGQGKPRWLFDETAADWIPADGFPPLIRLAN